MRTFRALFAASCLSAAPVLCAQDGALDLSFNPTDAGFGSSDGTGSGDVRSIAMQADGKIIIGGQFTSYNSTLRKNIARLNADGSLDASFDPGSGAIATSVSSVKTTTLQPDGKIIIGGVFNSYNGWSRKNIARSNADGSIDQSFNPGTGANSDVYSTTLQPDGKIIISGYFTTYNGTARARIARLNADGSLDLSFAPGIGPNTYIYATAVQPDGKILIGGAFTSFTGTPRNRIARLNADGTLDTSFDPGSGASSYVLSISIQPDSKILIGGQFTSYNGTARSRIARLNDNGSLDTSFDPGSGGDHSFFRIALQPDGKLIVAGSFNSYNGTARNDLARLNADGSLDASFDPGVGLAEGIRTLALLPDGKLIISGGLISYSGAVRRGIARLNSSGSFDTSFSSSEGGANGTVVGTCLQSGGRIIIAGGFTSYNAIPRVRFAGVNTDGSLDASFDPGAGTTSHPGDAGVTQADPYDPGQNYIQAVAVQPDNKIIIAGDFPRYDGTPRKRIARSNADGSLDPSFDPGSGPVSGAQRVNSITVQTDGKIMIGGSFYSYNGIARKHIARLNADGSLDTSFDPGSGANFDVSQVIVQPDGRIIVGGSFNSFNGIGRNGIARLNPDGSLDASFDPGTGASSSVLSTALQPNGKILIGGFFTSYNGTPRVRIARLNANGSLDTSFDPGLGFDGAIGTTHVRSITVQPDGKILVGGSFSSYNGTTRNCFARLNPNGSLDTSFDPGTGANGMVWSAALQSDGGIIIGGAFTSYNGIGRNRIARINGTARAGIRVILEGPYNGSTMNDALRTLPSFPLTEPFTAMGYSETGYTPGATIAPSVLTATGNNAIVDWVIVEMRPAATPNVVSASRAVLLQRDGDVVDLDGISSVGFSGLAHGNYCIAVKPRTHLPVMLSPSTPFAYGTSTATVDFTLPATQVYDNDARKNVGGVMLLQAGDVSFNEVLQYIGAGNDRDPILVRVGGSTPTATAFGYYPEDVNMDGVVKYVGAANDRDPILLNIGGSNPTAITQAQLP